MPGFGADKFANLRAYYGFMWGHPGKKLLFMGCEFAQGGEWNHNHSLDWHLLDHDWHRGVQAMIRDMNKLYTSTPALYELDSKPDGFEWVEESNADESVFAWIRKGKSGTAPVLVVCNMTPIERTGHRIGVPEAGRWVEVLNSDAAVYGGGGRGNLGFAETEQVASHGRANSLSLTLPPLSTLFFELERG
jgi:1,4-alpha-glucan branching enzyme